MKRKFNLNIGCIIKVLLLLSVIMGGVFLFLNFSGGSCIQKIDKTLPDIQTAPWAVTTPTRNYLAKEVSKTGTGVVMNVWYEQVKGKWVKHPDSIILEYKVYGRITVDRR